MMRLLDVGVCWRIVTETVLRVEDLELDLVSRTANVRARILDCNRENSKSCRTWFATKASGIPGDAIAAPVGSAFRPYHEHHRCLRWTRAPQGRPSAYLSTHPHRAWRRILSPCSLLRPSDHLPLSGRYSRSACSAR